MSKPGQQPKSGSPSKPTTKRQWHARAPVGPPPRTVARLWPYLKAALTLAIIGYVLVIVGRTGPVNALLIRIGWRDSPSTIERR